MSSITSKISFKILYRNHEYNIVTYPTEYENLMELINNKIFMEDFGDCKGMAQCGTCLIQFHKVGKLPPVERNEFTILIKNNINMPSIRLACQIQVEYFLTDAVIEIMA